MMTSRKRFLLGGLGALMPVLLSFLALDISAALNGSVEWTPGMVMGAALRYLVLFVVGGVVAYLHSEESKPFKLFELGIVAPALVTSLVTAQGVNAASTPLENKYGMQIDFVLISTAYATEDQEKLGTDKPVSKFFQDVVSGLTGKVYQDIKKPAEDTKAKTDKPKE